MKKNRELRAAYKIVIQDLYATREQLNQAIEALGMVFNEETRSRGVATIQAFAPAEKDGTGVEAEEASRTLIAAIKEVLRRSNHPLGNAEIYRRLKAAGIKFRSKNPQLSVSQVLSRSSKMSGGPIRVGRGKWAPEE